MPKGCDQNFVTTFFYITKTWYPEINQIEFAYILNSKGKMKIEPKKQGQFFTKNIFFY
ncbi:hypothetical protein NUITMVRE5_16730 [Enterococcus faecium]|nr:hypothetical protein [Enterococcus faecium]GMR72896.1 hypothetical protein NUITMVRE10_15880 [Enterococcus faecium]GMR75876.1 hypothetical protein NUITMVRE11_16030 [Enterococcus faecium]GMS37078.1 hypothetical protein NUITMVRE30_19470 [Enterococcus faecium]GMS39935.1 hypothetical protein NUITMVRE31_19930 [Enterococcus faecium]